MQYLVAVLIIWGVFGCSSEHDCITGNRRILRQEVLIAEFESIVLNTHAEVYIWQDSITPSRLIVEAESNILPELEAKVQNRRLSLSRKRCFSTGKGIKYFITVRRLHSITLNGTGNIYLPHFISSSPFFCYLPGSGNIEFNYNGPFLNTELSGSGNITISGNTPLHEVRLSGSGSVNALGLITQESTVSISGSGDAKVYCERTLNAHISGSGNIIYRGNPLVNSRITGLGRLIHFQ